MVEYDLDGKKELKGTVDIIKDDEMVGQFAFYGNGDVRYGFVPYHLNITKVKFDPSLRISQIYDLQMAQSNPTDPSVDLYNRHKQIFTGLLGLVLLLGGIFGLHLRNIIILDHAPINAPIHLIILVVPLALLWFGIHFSITSMEIGRQMKNDQN